MSDIIYSVSTLLKDVKRLQKHQREIERIKGETFNIFSILGVESKENRTHSNFIAELLNPKSGLYKDIVSKVANESIQFINDHSDTIIKYYKEEKINPLG